VSAANDDRHHAVAGRGPAARARNRRGRPLRWPIVPAEKETRPMPAALICGSMAYDTIMVFEDRFKNHILPD
jgi:hypothetical protein